MKLNIHQKSFVHESCVFGDVPIIIEEGVYIGPFCSIGLPPEWKGRENDNKGVIIKKGTRITGHVTIDGGANSQTVIGENCYIMKHAHVGHDAQIGDNVTLSCGVKIGGHSIIGNSTNIGLNAVIHQKLTIPEGCMIGASSFVGKKSILQPNYKYAGVPVKELSPNVH